MTLQFKTSQNSTKDIKDNLAQKVENWCAVPVVAHTRKGALQSDANMINISSNQEEADTLLILYGVAVSRAGHGIHIYGSDTDVFILALHRLPELGPKTVMIMGTGEHRRRVSRSHWM